MDDKENILTDNNSKGGNSSYWLLNRPFDSLFDFIVVRETQQDSFLFSFTPHKMSLMK